MLKYWPLAANTAGEFALASGASRDCSLVFCERLQAPGATQLAGDFALLALFQKTEAGH